MNALHLFLLGPMGQRKEGRRREEGEGGGVEEGVDAVVTLQAPA